jgi:hypothetical protein
MGYKFKVSHKAAKTQRKAFKTSLGFPLRALRLGVRIGFLNFDESMVVFHHFLWLSARKA